MYPFVFSVCLLFPFLHTSISVCISPISECDCSTTTDGNVINCARKGFTFIPMPAPSMEQFYSLLLNDNDITTITEYAFNGLDVQRINMLNNALNNISLAAFQGLEGTLQEILLEGDGNEGPPFDALQPLSRLRVLTLRRFHLPSFETNANYLGYFPNLQELEMSSFALNYIAPESFSNVTELLKLHLQSNSFTSLPLTAMQQLTKLKYLSFEGNSIEEIGQDAFSAMTDLQDLNLIQNAIVTLDPNCFHGLESSLQYLGLSINALDSNDLAAFSILRQLEQLTLAHNSIETIPAGVFQNNENLHYISLNNNQVRHLTQSMMIGLDRSLIHLDLNENPLEIIEDNTFENLRDLQELTLNSLTLGASLSWSSVRGLESSLIRLDLGASRIKATDAFWLALKSLTYLIDLDLSQNNLNDIPNFAFERNVHLQNLKLDENNLNNVTQETFFGLRDTLNSVSLRGNSLTTLDECVFQNFTTLTAIQLGSNPLHCDCQLRWLRVWMDEIMNPTVVRFTVWLCSSPPEHNGDKFVDLLPENFTCSGNTSKLICVNYYTTTPIPTTSITELSTAPPTTAIQASTTQPPTTIKRLTLSIDAIIRTDSIKITWTLNYQSEFIEAFYITHEDVATQNSEQSRDLHKTTRAYDIVDLTPHTRYEVCVWPRVSQGSFVQGCKSFQTETVATTVAPTTSGQGQLIGIIVGSIVGGIVLIIVIIAIVYILLKGKKRKPEHVYAEPIDPKQWSKPETSKLPNSKRYVKKEQKKGDADRDINIQIISEGKTDPGRLSAGSYQYLRTADMDPVSERRESRDQNHADHVKSQNMNGRPLPLPPGPDNYVISQDDEFEYKPKYYEIHL